jgi:hypothetical protein
MQQIAQVIDEKQEKGMTWADAKAAVNAAVGASDICRAPMFNYPASGVPALKDLLAEIRNGNFVARP